MAIGGARNGVIIEMCVCACLCGTRWEVTYCKWFLFVHVKLFVLNPLRASDSATCRAVYFIDAA